MQKLNFFLDTTDDLYKSDIFICDIQFRMLRPLNTCVPITNYNGEQ